MGRPLDRTVERSLQMREAGGLGSGCDVRPIGFIAEKPALKARCP